MDFKKYLANLKFEKQLKRLKKCLKNKKIIIYGSGTLFQFIKENYDLSDLNIIGLSDGKYTQEDFGTEFLGYKVIPKNNIHEYKPDYIIVGILDYVEIIYNLEHVYLKNPNIKIIPLVQKKFRTIMKYIWLN